MPENSRLQTRRQRRRRPNRTAIAFAGIAALIAVAALIAGSVWIATRHAAPTPQSQQRHIRPKPIASRKPAAGSTTTVPPAASLSSSEATSTAASPETLSAAEASTKAVKKAAVPFPGAPPISPTTLSINHLHPRHKYIALTLDDGYGFQPALLALLKQYDAHCTTFLVGSWAAANKPDLKMMRDAGFEIANHSWTHPFLTRMSTSQIQSELTKTQRVISSVTGDQAPYLRPPFGDTDSHVKAVAAGLGYRIVMWDRTFGDSGRGATPKKLYANVVTSHGGVQPGDVILCHWGSKPSYEALKKILPDLQAQGYQFVTISELIADSKPQN